MNTSPYVVPLNGNDAESLFMLMTSNTGIFSRFFPITLQQNQSVADSRHYIKKKTLEANNRTEFTFAIKEQETAGVVGLTILKNLDWELGRGEVAYCLDKRHHGKGWVTLAVQELSMFAFNELGLHVLQILVHKSNLASINVAKKCGYVWKQTLTKSYQPPNEAALDMEEYLLEKP